MGADLPDDRGRFGVGTAWHAVRCVWVWLHSPLPAFPDPQSQQGAVCLRCRRRTWKQSLYGHVVVRLLQNESECCYIRGVGQADRLLSDWNTHFRWRVCERGKLETHTHTPTHTFWWPTFQQLWDAGIVLQQGWYEWRVWRQELLNFTEKSEKIQLTHNNQKYEMLCFSCQTQYSPLCYKLWFCSFFFVIKVSICNVFYCTNNFIFILSNFMPLHIWDLCCLCIQISWQFV